MDTAARIFDYDDGISAIDTEYVRPMVAASHLVVDSGRAAFIDTGTTPSVPRLLAALEAKGIDRGQVDWVLPTHVHLDHAGGSGRLMQELPNATCVVHPRGVRHLIDPTRLIAGSIDVYGEARFHRLYGEIVPIPESRVKVPADGERIRLGSRTLELVFTPGHALHHYCVIDLDHRGIFSGDNLGISYRDFDVEGRAFVIPTTTPVHFDPDAFLASLDRLMAYAPKAAYLTHFGRVLDTHKLAADLRQRVLEFVRLARRCAQTANRGVLMRAEMFRLFSAWLDEHGYKGDAAERHRLLDEDVELNVQGLEVWLDR